MLRIQTTQHAGTVGLVLIGSIDPGDSRLLAAAFLQVSESAHTIHFLPSRLREADKDVLSALRHEVQLVRARGIDCTWCSPEPDVATFLVAPHEVPDLVRPDPADVRAGAGAG